MKYLRGLLLLSFFLAASLIFAGGQQGAGTEKEIVVGVTDIVTYFDPAFNTENVSMRVMKNLHETLIEVADDGTIIPRLAESWKIIDARTIEFTLRKGVVSQAGFPLDADDVVVSYGPGRTMNEGDPCYHNFKARGVFIESVERIDDYTVRIKMVDPDPLLLLRFSMDAAAIICGDSFKNRKSWEDWKMHPVGFGPYYLEEYNADEYMVFRKFKDYYGDKAPLERIKYVVIPETSPRIMGLLSGDYDIIMGVLPDQFDVIKGKKGFEVLGGLINNIRIIIYDSVSSPVLKDPRVRLALSYSIDRELINKTIFKGLSEVPNGLQMKNFGDLYIKEFKPIGFNPQKAKQLLKEAGYKGEEITYRYLLDYYTGEVATAQILQQMWADVGLNVKLELKENWAQIETDEAAPGRAIINWSGTAVLPDPLVQLGRLYGPSGWFQVHNIWKPNAEFNDWYKALAGVDQAERRKAFARMLDFVENGDPPGTFLYVLPVFYGKKASVDWKPVGQSHFMDFRAGRIKINR
jgi:peptide/nickel transport system substrate-binding protein